jgi:L-serine dehydratase
MQSIRHIFKIGHGPSSSHTMAPRTASAIFLQRYPDAASYRVCLYGSLAATGLGHLTDITINQAFEGKKMELVMKPEEFLKRHPNGMFFQAFNPDNSVRGEWTSYSIGGGDIDDESGMFRREDVYPLNSMEKILEWCYANGKAIWEIVSEYEDPDIWDYLAEAWKVMQASIKRGLETEGTLPGVLKLPRKAPSYNVRILHSKDYIRKRTSVYAYALAVSEENASGSKIVTAPTCGACGVLPAVLNQNKTFYKTPQTRILRAMATAGIIGNLVKTNASISGAEVGCQGEVGTACAMASGALCQLYGGSIFQIEYAAEMGLEHHLGLTCDPVAGLVQIPCIERNALAASRALSHSDFALLSDGRHLIGFDQVVETMQKTGQDLPSLYKETSTGGLALYHGLDKRGRCW